MISRHLIFGLLALASVSVLVVTAQQNNAPAEKQSTSTGKHKRIVQTQDEGERVFQQHCSRCHAAPEGFSPRISGTIVLHMGVRASLSQHEKEVLRHFFNP